MKKSTPLFKVDAGSISDVVRYLVYLDYGKWLS